MSAEENKAIVRQYYDEIWSKGNVALIDELFAPNYVNYDPATPGVSVHGTENFKQFIKGYRTSFPDLHFTIEDQVVEGDTVVSRWTARGTQQGELLGIPPTGMQATVTGITLSRLSSGKIVEDRVNWDTLGLLQQLGVIPSMG